MLAITPHPSYNTDSEDFRTASKCWVHDIEPLLELAGLKTKRNADAAANANLDANWVTVRAWRETSRYERKTQADAQALYDAITQDPDGVLLWIRLHW